MDTSLPFSGNKTIHLGIRNVHCNSSNSKYHCRDEIYKINKGTYLILSLSYNQLRRCNVPPNHRPVCSSISQQHYHPQAGHDSTRIKGKLADSHVTKGIQLHQVNTVGLRDYLGNWKNWMLI